MKLLLLSVFFVSALVNAEAESDVEIQQVEVIEIPWQEEPQQYGPPPPPKQEYEPSKQVYGPPPLEYGPPKQVYGPPPHEYEPPKQVYGPPPQEYGPPKPVYGPPPELTTTEAETTTTEIPTTTVVSSNSTGKGTNSTRARLESGDSVDRGSYYVYHPSGLLQRVVYATKDDVRNMEFSARLRYQNVDPVKGPIYTYDPETYTFGRINRK